MFDLPSELWKASAGNRLGGSSANRLGTETRNSPSSRFENFHSQGNRLGGTPNNHFVGTASNSSGNRLDQFNHDFDNFEENLAQQTETFENGNQIIRQTTTTIPMRIGAQRLGGFSRESMRDAQGARIIRTRRFIVNGQPTNESSTVIQNITENFGEEHFIQNQPMRIVIGDNFDGAGYGKFFLNYAKLLYFEETLLDLEDHEAGAEKEEIDALPEVTLNEPIQEYECPICMEDMVAGAVVRTLPCFHRLHKDCIDKWLEVKKTCPICKTSVSGESD